MARKSNIDALPPDLRQALDKLLLDSNFGVYESIADYFQERGYRLSKSSVHRYGQKLERRLAAIKASTEAAKLLADNVDDAENHLSGSVISLVQTELFETLLNLQEAESSVDPLERMELLSKAAKSIAEVSRASIANKKWQVEVRTKAELAANKVDAIARKSGLSAEAAASIRREILGIAP